MIRNNTVAARTHLSSNHHRTPISRIDYGQTLATKLHCCNACLAPHIPELASPITRDRSEFRLLDRIPSYSFDGTTVAA